MHPTTDAMSEVVVQRAKSAVETVTAGGPGRPTGHTQAWAWITGGLPTAAVIRPAAAAGANGLS